MDFFSASDIQHGFEVFEPESPPATPRRATRESSPESSDLTLLQHYLREIRDIPLLSAEEEREFSDRLRAAEGRIRAALLGHVETARWILARWQQLRASARVTAGLCGLDSVEGEAGSRKVDRMVSRIGTLLARRERLASARARRDERQAVERALERALQRLAPPIELLLEALPELGDRGASDSRLREAHDAMADYRDVRERFVRHNVRLVVALAKEFRGMGVSYLDLIQEANIGLIRAVEKFDGSRGFRFSTYAAWWIRQACVRAVQRTSRTVRLPSNLCEKLVKYRRAMRAFEEEHCREPERRELAELLETDEQAVGEMQILERRPVSLDEPLPGGENSTVADRLFEVDESPPEAGVDQERLAREVPDLLRRLTPRERQVLDERFGLREREARTLEQIGRELGLSRERVRQIEREALGKLREEAAQRGLDTLVH